VQRFIDGFNSQSFGISHFFSDPLLNVVQRLLQSLANANPVDAADNFWLIGRLNIVDGCLCWSIEQANSWVYAISRSQQLRLGRLCLCESDDKLLGSVQSALQQTLSTDDSTQHRQQSVWHDLYTALLLSFVLCLHIPNTSDSDIYTHRNKNTSICFYDGYITILTASVKQVPALSPIIKFTVNTPVCLSFFVLCRA